MTHDHGTDPLLGLLAELPAAMPSAVSTARVRARAHAALARRRNRRSATTGSIGRRVVDGMLYFACCGYLVGAIVLALR